MDHESEHLKGPSSLLSPVYLEGKNLVKNKLLDEPFTKTSSASNTLSSLSLNNKSLKSSINLSYTGSILHCDHEVTVGSNDKHHEEKKTSVPSSLKSTPIDWLNDAIIKISDTSFQNILECTVDDSTKRNSIHNTFGDLLTYERRDTYKQLKALKRSQNGVVVSKDIDAIIYRLAHSPRIYFTIKELIRRLHISRPKFNVMCVLGKPYPSDITDFIRMGLEGDWDSSKAGTCMKFPIPVTWETELSVNGNNSDSWSKLISKFHSMLNIFSTLGKIIIKNNLKIVLVFICSVVASRKKHLSDHYIRIGVIQDCRVT
ncbi:unnamed protein product [Schistosoma margrebowiei]|uniref:Uncharacterized protein n=1 Tax=Schistosoma margrebowiei TaxID=48269 RepID=A0A183LTK5_9TREM|nr:unnamed protein product [Schistosoma margrebowiei]